MSTQEVRRGTVKWFDFAKRYGFVTLEGEKIEDAMLHLSCLREHKVAEVYKGSEIECTCERTDRGLSVKEVFRLTPPADDQNGYEYITATVKWFDGKRGYGFLTRGDGTPDIFIHAVTIKASAMVELQPEQKVLVVVEKAGHGPKATRIRAPDA